MGTRITINRRAFMLGGALLMIAALLLFVGQTTSLIDLTHSTPAAAASTGDGTTADPFTGNAGNDAPVLPSQVESWAGVVSVGEKPATQWYQACVTSRLNVTWDQVKRAARLEAKGALVQGILVSNTAPPADPHKMLEQQLGVKVDPRAPIILVGGFDNTRGLDGDQCNPFGDGRAQVRLTLLLPAAVMYPPHSGVPLDKPLMDRGVLMHCGNPWKLLPPGTAPIPAPQSPGGGGSGTTPSTSPPGTTPTTTPPPPTSKCVKWTYFGGKWYCGTPTSGPEQQGVQDNDSALGAPTPGYTAGNLEVIVGNQPKVNSGKPDRTPTSHGSQNSGSLTSGVDQNNGDTDTGGTAGWDHPQDDDPNPGQTNTSGDVDPFS